MNVIYIKNGIIEKKYTIISLHNIGYICDESLSNKLGNGTDEKTDTLEIGGDGTLWNI